MARAQGLCARRLGYRLEKAKVVLRLRRGVEAENSCAMTEVAAPSPGLVGCSRAQFDRVTRAHEILVSTPPRALLKL